VGASARTSAAPRSGLLSTRGNVPHRRIPSAGDTARRAPRGRIRVAC
jgi:hypothetical protein